MGTKREPEKKLPEVFYDARSEKYFMRMSPTHFQLMSEANLKLHLIDAGFDPEEKHNDTQKKWDKYRVMRQQFDRVDYAGPLAGQKCGLLDVGGGQRVLVVSQADIPEPKRGKWDFIAGFLGELFSPDPEQLRYALLWLKIGYESLRRGVFQPGQCAVVAGGAMSGKSFFQHLHTQLFGGRRSDPFKYMSGKTQFNSELAGCESLPMEDPTAHSSLAARRDFGTALKNWTVDETMRIHAKGRDALNLPFFRRLSMSVNDEPEYLMALPPMDASIMDKIMLFKVARTNLSEDRAKNRERLREELPAFAFHLTTLKVPESMRDTRMRVKSYHNPEILEILRDASDENKLEELIDSVIVFTDGPWSGTAMDLQMELTTSKYGAQAGAIFRYASACGTYLARLAVKHPTHYLKTKNGGQTRWTIGKKP